MAEAAPGGRAFDREGQAYHEALYDEWTAGRLVELKGVLEKCRQPIEHTTDGGASWFTGAMQWGCFARRAWREPLQSGIATDHEDVCASYFGCLYAQERQEGYFHDEGLECFWHDRHGRFRFERDEDEKCALSGFWPPSLWAVLERTRFYLDRERVRWEVLGLVHRWGANRCPRFQAGYLERQVRRLPTVVVAGGRWRIVKAANGKPGVGYACYRKPLLTAQASLQKRVGHDREERQTESTGEVPASEAGGTGAGPPGSG